MAKQLTQERDSLRIKIVMISTCLVMLAMFGLLVIIRQVYRGLTE